MARFVFPHKGRLCSGLSQGIFLTHFPQVDNLTKILFTKAHALCHDVNDVMKSSTHIDLVLGFSTGDIIWYEPMSQKYARLNKNVSRLPKEEYLPN